jgi:hypothetical protein
MYASGSFDATNARLKAFLARSLQTPIMNDECLNLEAKTSIGLMVSTLEHVWIQLKPMAPLSKQ